MIGPPSIEQIDRDIINARYYRDQAKQRGTLSMVVVYEDRIDVLLERRHARLKRDSADAQMA